MTQVLVVDDERVIRDLLRFGLEIEGYEVVTLPDGREVVETLRALREPCVVLMDLMMPEKSGWDVCQELEREPALRRHPLAIMTASLQTGDTPPSPARRLIPKPFLLDNVLDVVAALAAESAAPVAHLAPVQAQTPHAVARWMPLMHCNSSASWDRQRRIPARRFRIIKGESGWLMYTPAYMSAVAATFDAR